jgi:hypothetical protein
MNDYMVLMHDHALESERKRAPSEEYFKKRQASGQFVGGSSIGHGECVAKSRQTRSFSAQLTGYIRVRAESLQAAKKFLEGNPVYEAGGTVEIRELPPD